MPRRLLLSALVLLWLPACGANDDAGRWEPADPAIADYIALLAQAEQQAQLGPVEMLALMRQLYYGESWSATDPHLLWHAVIPCSPELGDPRTIIGETLYGELASRAEIGGVDMGHIFAGLEAMLCPFEPVLIVEMSNEDFATWGGDLGAIAAARSACAKMGPDAAASGLCGHREGGQSLDFYTEVHLPPQDLEGDLDPLAMRPVLLGSSCAESRLTPLVLERPLSEVLHDYYFEPQSALGRARAARDRCFLDIIGAQYRGGQLRNRPTLLDEIAPQVASFGEAYYWVIRSDVFPDEEERAEIAGDARTVTDAFLTARAAP